MLKLKLSQIEAWLFIKKGNKLNERYNIIKLEIERAYNISKQNLRIMKDLRGKPYILKANIYLSCSYTEGYWAFIIAKRNIGLDIEKIKKAREEVIRKIYYDDEKRYVNLGNRNVRFFTIWTMKEAYCKWSGDGLLGIRKVNVLDDNSGVKFLNIRYRNLILSICWKNNDV